MAGADGQAVAVVGPRKGLHRRHLDSLVGWRQPSQVDELVEALPEYVNVGVSRRPDGSDEFSAIYFRRDRFHLSDAGTPGPERAAVPLLPRGTDTNAGMIGPSGGPL